MAWNEEDPDDEHDLDPEGPDEADLRDDPAQVPCPYCSREIDEESVRCAYCGNYLSVEDAPSKRNWVGIIAAALLILLVLAYFVRH